MAAERRSWINRLLSTNYAMNALPGVVVKLTAATATAAAAAAVRRIAAAETDM